MPGRKRTPEEKAKRAEQALARYYERGYDQRLQRQYGITAAQYDEMLDAQGRVCAICYRDRDNRVGYRFAVDHNHTTGIVRGALCSMCNVGIAKLGEDPERLRRAADYLELPPLSGVLDDAQTVTQTAN